MITRWSLLSLMMIFGANFFPSMSYGSAIDDVKTAVNQVIRIVNDKEMKKPQNEIKRRSKLKEAIGSLFDYDEMAKRSMAIHWKERSPAEKKEFIALFEILLEKSYSRKLETYNNEKIIFLREILDGDYAEVKSKLVTSKRDEYQMEYRLSKKGSKWMVYDVAFEGVSLVSNYRSQFNKIISSQGYPELVKKIRNKVQETSTQ